MPARRIPLERPPTKADEVRVKHRQAVWRARIGANLREAGTETGLSQRQLSTRSRPSQCARAWVGERDGAGCGAEEVGCGCPDAETRRALAALRRHVARLRR